MPHVCPIAVLASVLQYSEMYKVPQENGVLDYICLLVRRRKEGPKGSSSVVRKEATECGPIRLDNDYLEF